MKLDDRYVYACEKLGWTVKEYDDGTINISQYSPAGEDFSFDVNADSFVDDIYAYYENFDIDEHIEMWIEARRSGMRNVPSTRVLVSDAEAIDKMLENLSIAVSEVDMNNDNDLIYRRDLLGLLHAFVCGAKKYDANDCSELEKICREELSKAVVGMLGDFEKLIGELPTIEQPMSAMDFARAELRFNEMCGSTACKECELGSTCKEFSTWEEPKKRVEFLQKWTQEHPIVPEMSAVEYLITEARWRAWCESKFASRSRTYATCVDVFCEYADDKCARCKLSPQEKVAFLEKWVREHPERREEK